MGLCPSSALLGFDLDVCESSPKEEEYVPSQENPFLVQRQDDTCTTATSCDDCVLNTRCGWCVISSAGVTRRFCTVDQTSACVDPYGGSGVGIITRQCDTVPSNVKLVTIFMSNNPSDISAPWVRAAIAAGVSSWNTFHGTSGSLSPDAVLLTQLLVAGEKRQGVSAVTVGFADTVGYPSKTAYKDLISILKQQPGLLAPIQVAGFRELNGGSGGGHHQVEISGGALAGIIIGALVVAAIIVAIIACIIYRRKIYSYPLPFRSPAAAYRP